MKRVHLATTMAAATTTFAGTCSFAQDKPVEKRVAVRVTTHDRFVSAAAKGGLNTRGAKIAGNQTFVLVDLNGGGDLAEGDAVQIRWGGTGSKSTEGEGTVGRYGGRPTDASTFKIKLKERSGENAPQRIVLQTASGKFVSVPEKGAAVATTEVEDKAATLDIMVVPEAEAAETKPTETKDAE